MNVAIFRECTVHSDSATPVAGGTVSPLCKELVEEFQERDFLILRQLLQSSGTRAGMQYQNTEFSEIYSMGGNLVDLGFVCFLTRYCFVCHILLGQVGIRQNGQITLAAMVERTKSQSTKNSLHYRIPSTLYSI